MDPAHLAARRVQDGELRRHRMKRRVGRCHHFDRQEAGARGLELEEIDRLAAMSPQDARRLEDRGAGAPSAARGGRLFGPSEL